MKEVKTLQTYDFYILGVYNKIGCCLWRLVLDIWKILKHLDIVSPCPVN